MNVDINGMAVLSMHTQKKMQNIKKMLGCSLTNHVGDNYGGVIFMQFYTTMKID